MDGEGSGILTCFSWFLNINYRKKKNPEFMSQCVNKSEIFHTGCGIGPLMKSPITSLYLIPVIEISCGFFESSGYTTRIGAQFSRTRQTHSLAAESWVLYIRIKCYST